MTTTEFLTELDGVLPPIGSESWAPPTDEGITNQADIPSLDPLQVPEVLARATSLTREVRASSNELGAYTRDINGIGEALAECTQEIQATLDKKKQVIEAIRPIWKIQGELRREIEGVHAELQDLQHQYGQSQEHETNLRREYQVRVNVCSRLGRKHQELLEDIEFEENHLYKDDENTDTATKDEAARIAEDLEIEEKRRQQAKAAHDAVVAEMHDIVLTFDEKRQLLTELEERLQTNRELFAPFESVLHEFAAKLQDLSDRHLRLAARYAVLHTMVPEDVGELKEEFELPAGSEQPGPSSPTDIPVVSSEFGKPTIVPVAGYARGLASDPKTA